MQSAEQSSEEPIEKGGRADHLALLKEIIEKRLLEAHFQPIVDLKSGEVIGHEGLIRGPLDTPLRSPVELFRLAGKHGQSMRLERLCRQTVLERFSRLGLPSKLFLNVRPQCLALPGLGTAASREMLRVLHLSADRIVIELTENLPIFDFDSVRTALTNYRSLGFNVAIDDLGEGFASFRLWSELRPEYVKADMHFVQGIDVDPLKLQFLKSIQQIAETCRSLIIAEGIETEAELEVVRDLGIPFGQGYLLGRPSADPILSISPTLTSLLKRTEISVYPETVFLQSNAITADKLLIQVDAVSPDTPTEVVYAMFERVAGLHAIPVVENGVAVGLINRNAFIDGYVRPYRKELFGRRACSHFMDPQPLIVEVDISIQELSHRLVDAESRYLAEGFILTSRGRYVGLGTGRDLMHEITHLQIRAARYANPLTLLPGNVPISEHIERLLSARNRFVSCYCDLDHFKPFNDRYGYRKGDDMIQLTGHILSEVCDPRRDFLGHIGGDDFMLLLQSPDWAERCKEALEGFDRESTRFYSEEDLARGGFYSEDRQGSPITHPLASLSIGAVMAEPGEFASHYEVSAAAAEAKRQAKRQIGSSLFVERRKPDPERSGENTGAYTTFLTQKT